MTHDEVVPNDTEVNSIIEAVKKTIMIHGKQKRDEAYLMAGGRQYTLNQILQEVEQETDFGRGFINDFYMLTIDLLLRKKNVLNSPNGQGHGMYQKLIDSARKIKHWHDAGNDGMVVSRESVFELWDALKDFEND